MYKRIGLEPVVKKLNQSTKFVFKHVISALTLSKATEEFIGEETEARSKGKQGKMVEPLTNAILASILHLIRRDLTGKGSSMLAPPRRAPTCQWHRRTHRSRPRAGTPPPQYRPMELSPPRATE
jgi:hypothetical protein